MAMIYRITNVVTGDFYIGKTKNTVEKRWCMHKRNAGRGIETHFYRSIRKYGVENFKVDILEDCDSICDNEKEKYWIKKLKPQYNMTAGGDGGWIKDQTGNHWKVRDASKMGRAWREGKQREVIDYKQISDGNNYQSKYYIFTPWGKYETWKRACSEAKKLKKQGKDDVITDVATLRKYCKEDIILSNEGRRTYPDWRGKSTKQLGFFIEEKNGRNKH